MKLTVCLPVLIHQEILSDILSSDEICLLREIRELFQDGPDKIEEVNVSTDLKLKQILEIFNKYPNIHTMAEGLLKECSPDGISMIHNLNFFNKLMEARIKMIPQEKRNRKKKALKSLVDLKKAEVDVETLQANLDKLRSEHLEFVEKISAEIARDESIIAEIKRKHKEEISEEINNSEFEMLETYKKMRAKQDIVQDELNASKKLLHDQMESNLTLEKELHKLQQVEKRFLAILEEYDSEIGERHETMEKLTAKSNGLRDDLEQLRKEYASQEIIYNNLKEEKELAEMKAFTEKMDRFKENRAARIIQRAWKMYLERMAQKKKKKSKKKQ
ncbi:IQ domain-containing protein D-like [Orussus abietinus]|uniref:IQ domain-containing protein D-like n=1 Tax=Orussus abietinus TaxID=222816 RepID=UPI0006267D3D|nr:IQ domain-containing protein D-like [Orussus abietinus]